MSHGPGESRMVEEKRHYEKPIPVSDLVLLDRERCILCDRCTRFADEVAGEPLIHFMDRGNETEVNTFPDHPFASYFSGNTVQICPVGALTSSSYRFKARPWDLGPDRVHLPGLRGRVPHRGRLVPQPGPAPERRRRRPGQLGLALRQGPLRLRGHRVRRPPGRPAGPDLGRRRAGRASWSEALKAAAGALRAARDGAGPDGIAVLGGARLTNEDAYAWAKLAKGVLGTDHVDAQLGDGLPAEAVLGLPRATIDELCRPGGTVLWLGPDPKEELPVLFLRLRHAVLARRRPARRRSRPRPRCSTTWPWPPSTRRPASCPPSSPPCSTVARPPRAPTPTPSSGPGRPWPTTSPSPSAAARSPRPPATPSTPPRSWPAAARRPLPAPPASGQRPRRPRHGPGPRRAARPGQPGPGADRLGVVWSTVPSGPGLDATGILQAAAEGKVDVLVLLGADPLTDHPDRELADPRPRRGPHGHRHRPLPHRVVAPGRRGAGRGRAQRGRRHPDQLEGRISVLGRAVTAPGTARPDWMIAAELARRLGADLGLESVADIWAEIEAVVALPRRHHHRASWPRPATAWWPPSPAPVELHRGRRRRRGRRGSRRGRRRGGARHDVEGDEAAAPEPSGEEAADDATPTTPTPTPTPTTARPRRWPRPTRSRSTPATTPRPTCSPSRPPPPRRCPR